MFNRWSTTLLGGCVLIVVLQYFSGAFENLPEPVVDRGSATGDPTDSVERDVLVDLQDCLDALAVSGSAAFPGSAGDPAVSSVIRIYAEHCAPDRSDPGWALFAADYGVLAIAVVRSLVEAEIVAVSPLVSPVEDVEAADYLWMAALGRAAGRVGEFRAGLVDLYSVVQDLPLSASAPDTPEVEP